MKLKTLYSRSVNGKTNVEMETEEIVRLKKQLIEISHNAMLLEEKLHQSVKFFTEPKITDSNAWWTGKDRVMTFASWSDAYQYWAFKTKK